MLVINYSFIFDIHIRLKTMLFSKISYLFEFVKTFIENVKDVEVGQTLVE